MLIAIGSLLWVCRAEPVFVLLAIEVTKRSGTSELCLYELTRIFGKFLANGFLSGGTATEKSENDRISTGFLVGLGGLEPPTSPLSG